MSVKTKISVKRVITALLCCMIAILAILCVSGQQKANAATYSGDCSAEGSNVKWSLDTSTWTLTVSGTGVIKEYVSILDIPWYEYRTNIKNIIISDGITVISPYTFAHLGVTSVTIGNSVTTIGEFAFGSCNSLERVDIPDSVTRIDLCAFGSCNSLLSVSIGENVVFIGEDAFACNSLTSVTFKEPRGWRISRFSHPGSSDLQDVSASDLENVHTAAKFLSKDIGEGYSLYYWHRAEHIHDYEKTVFEPTCAEKGVTTYTCECGYSYTEDAPALGHTEGNLIVDVPAEVGKEGSGHTECTICSEVVRTEVIPALQARGCFGGGMYLNHLFTVLIPAAFVFIGKWFIF